MLEQLLSSLGPVCAVIGAQWGDEGKGKAIDILAAHFDVVARAGGGANAGHTIVVDGKKHVFHLLPAGSLHEGKIIVLGAGMVIHLPTLLEEIALLEAHGVAIVPRLMIAPNAHLVFEYHKAIDGKTDMVGTTRRGIGPAYMDKAARTGLRMDILRQGEPEWRAILLPRAEQIGHWYGVKVDVAAEIEGLSAAKEKLQPCLMVNLPDIMQIFRDEGKRILIEGAQGTLLDLDHGTYPHVTSSQTTAAGALQGLGMPPRSLTSCIGVAKAYCTRVGAGTFPTEAPGERGDRLRERGGEYGATTGRPRRCGWLHLPDVKFAAAVNGIDCWNITKLDVLDEEAKIPVGVGMEGDRVIYEELPGWKTSTAGITDAGKLPKPAQRFIAFIEEFTGIPVRLIGTGQGRDEMIVRG